MGEGETLAGLPWISPAFHPDRRLPPPESRKGFFPGQKGVRGQGVEVDDQGFVRRIFEAHARFVAPAAYGKGGALFDRHRPCS